MLQLSVLGLIFLIVLILVAIFAPLVCKLVGAPGPDTADPNALDIFGDPTGPSSAHIFGVDQIGHTFRLGEIEHPCEEIAQMLAASLNVARVLQVARVAERTQHLLFEHLAEADDRVEHQCGIFGVTRQRAVHLARIPDQWHRIIGGKARRWPDADNAAERRRHPDRAAEIRALR